METTDKSAVKSGAAILLLSAIALLFVIPGVRDFAGISVNLTQAALVVVAAVLASIAIVVRNSPQTSRTFIFSAFWTLVAAYFMFLGISPFFLVLWTLSGSVAAMLGDMNGVAFIFTSVAFVIVDFIRNGQAPIGDYFALAIAGVLAPLVGSAINQKVKPTQMTKFLSSKADAESALKAEIVVNSISDGTIVVDKQGHIKLINPAAINIIGWGREDAIGLNFMSVLVLMDKDNNMLEAEDKNPVLIATKSGLTYESKDCQILTKYSGKKIPVSITVTPDGKTDDAEEKDDGNIVIVFRDIEKELRDASEQGEFISTASHEMRTPVASIEGYLGLALNPSTATIDDRARAYLSKAHDSSQHLGRLFADLLDVTKLDDNRIKLRPEPIDVVSFIRDAASGLIPQIEAKGLNYSYKPDKAVTGEKTLSPVFYTNVDPSFLRESVNNLVENAIKYNRPQGSIEVNVTGNDNNVVISVSDTGIGIPPEDINHLFQKFYRVDSSDTREIGGTGLGLYISKQRIEDMGGRMWVESEYGKGSTFFVSVSRISSGEYDRLHTELLSRHIEENDASVNAVTGTNPFVAPAPTAEPVPIPIVPMNTPLAETNSNYYPVPQTAATVAPQAAVMPAPVMPAVPGVAAPAPIPAPIPMPAPASAPVQQPVAAPMAPNAPTMAEIEKNKANYIYKVSTEKGPTLSEIEAHKAEYLEKMRAEYANSIMQSGGLAG